MNNQPELKRTLTLWQVIFLGLAWNTPMIYFSVFGVAYEGSNGFLTAAYMMAVLAVLFTGASYAIMAKKIPISGSAYTFAKKAIHPNAGFLVGWVLLLNYLFAPIIACITFGIFLHAEVPSVPAYVWIIGLIVLLAAIAIRGVNSSANISRLFVILQIIFMIVFCCYLAYGLLSTGGASSLMSAEPFLNVDMSLPVVLAGASIVVFSFLGFDTMTTLSEETIQPKKTIPKAIFIMISIVAFLHVGTSYFIQTALPNLSFVDPDSAALELVGIVGGSILRSIFITVLIAAIFTQGLASVTSVSRLLYVMGRDSILPNKWFGFVHPTLKTPVINIVIASIISLLAIFISIDDAIRFVNFGALSAFFFVNICVITLFFKNKKRFSVLGTLTNIIFPLIGAAFIAWLLALLDLPTIMGGLAWVAAGTVYLIYLTKFFTKPLPDAESIEQKAPEQEKKAI
ncbi:APC family permease [Halobacillus mangrovi]|uniref:Putrescine importer PuuP n=1 Tax=Halobacillus mangrovi TaxID=402384 RepID=A0A1W5ZQX7_9BACI|nr:APC family permease [Halobacillus mangrovi]ARI75667.1 Putrescine importer PuuP [Halobacillus mangrovi]